MDGPPRAYRQMDGLGNTSLQMKSAKTFEIYSQLLHDLIHHANWSFTIDVNYLLPVSATYVHYTQM